LKNAALPLAVALLCLALATSRATPVGWGIGGAPAGLGVLDATAIPTTTLVPVMYTNVNGEGYDVVVTTSDLQFDGLATVSGTDGFWFQGTPYNNSNYATLTFRFYLTGTTTPVALLGTDILFEDAEDQERFGNFSYYDDFGTQVPVLFNNTEFFNYSNGALFYANDTEAVNDAPEQGGIQLGETFECNLTQTAISGFTIHAHRQTTSAGSVIMMGLGDLSIPPIVQWRQSFFGANFANAAVAGDNADPAGDGLPNLLKYAFGLDPTTTETQTDPGLPVITAPDGFLQVSFNILDADTDITYIVQTSDDLVNWTNGTTYSATNGDQLLNGDTLQLSGTPIPGGTNVVVTDSIPLSATSGRYMRVLVTRP